MTGVPHEIGVRRTSHFLFETESMMLSAFVPLFFLAALPTIVVTYLTGSLPLLGGITVVAFGALAILGFGLLHWSSKVGGSLRISIRDEVSRRG